MIARASTDFAAERELLGGWIETFERVYGARPALRPLAGAPEGQAQLVFPPVFRMQGLVGSTSHFKSKPALVEHVRSLGFDWDAEGAILTIPTPATFNARAAALGLGEVGYGLTYTVEDDTQFSPGPWLISYYGGRIPIHMASPTFYTEFLRKQPADSLQFHFASFVHDVSVHALNYHLIPHAVIEAMGGRVREAMGEMWDDWTADAVRTAPRAMPFFLDNDLNRWGYEIWAMAATPEQFIEIASRPHNVDQLRLALDVRIQEAHIGLGDDGDGNGPPPFSPTHFSLQ
jgi:hypothetical protein